MMFCGKLPSAYPIILSNYQQIPAFTKQRTNKQVVISPRLVLYAGSGLANIELDHLSGVRTKRIKL
jgi:hypothetical protein